MVLKGRTLVRLDWIGVGGDQGGKLIGHVVEFPAKRGKRRTAFGLPTMSDDL